MKATGIVRRVDDLGRIVIPKEIRRTLRIREGDPLLKSIDSDRWVLMGYGDAPKETGRALKQITNHLLEPIKAQAGGLAILHFISCSSESDLGILKNSPKVITRSSQNILIVSSLKMYPGSLPSRGQTSKGSKFVTALSAIATILATHEHFWSMPSTGKRK